MEGSLQLLHEAGSSKNHRLASKMLQAQHISSGSQCILRSIQCLR